MFIIPRVYKIVGGKLILIKKSKLTRNESKMRLITGMVTNLDNEAQEVSSDSLETVSLERDENNNIIELGNEVMSDESM